MEWMPRVGSKTERVREMRSLAVTAGLLDPTCSPPFADPVSALLSLNRTPVHRPRASPTSAPLSLKKKPRRHDLPLKLEPALLRPAKPLAPEPKLGQCDYGKACNRAVLYLWPVMSFETDLLWRGAAPPPSIATDRCYC